MGRIDVMPCAICGLHCAADERVSLDGGKLTYHRACTERAEAYVARKSVVLGRSADDYLRSRQQLVHRDPWDDGAPTPGRDRR